MCVGVSSTNNSIPIAQPTVSRNSDSEDFDDASSERRPLEDNGAKENDKDLREITRIASFVIVDLRERVVQTLLDHLTMLVTVTRVHRVDRDLRSAHSPTLLTPFYVNHFNDSFNANALHCFTRRVFNRIHLKKEAWLHIYVYITL